LRRGLRLLRELLRELLLLLLDTGFSLCSCLLALLLCLLAAAAAACGAALALLRGCCAGTEGLSRLSLLSRLSELSELSRLSAPAQHGQGAGLHCGQALGLGTRLLLEPGKVCLAGTRSLFALLAALWASLAGIYFLAIVCRSGTQNLDTLVVTLWDSLTSFIFGIADLLAAFLAHVSSGAIAVSTLLWWLCQMAFELLCSIAKVFTSIFFIGVYILGLLLRIAFLIVFFGVIYCNQEVLWVLKGHVLGSYRRLQPVLWQLYQVAMVTWHRATTSQPWRRLVDWVLTNWSQGGRRMNQGREQLDAGQVPQPRPALSRARAGQRHQTPREELGTSGGRAARRQQLNATAGNAEGTLGNNAWALLKEQEECKKCVICQDQTKTVLLLPCRHLCLCQECTEVLLQQDVDQRNCPLCRRMILQTLNVYL
ncbi:RNF26 ligase, partial [Erythrocercus mccallii]|nr:RNF26 ligase [Erythrocercus mccallii]